MLFRSNLAVSASLNGTNFDLSVVDASGRTLSDISLTPTADATPGVAGDPVTGQLKITAIDPNLSADKISKDFVVTRGTLTVSDPNLTTPNIPPDQINSQYVRFSADYRTTANEPFKLIFGAIPNQTTITGDPADSISAFVDRLNNNQAFSAVYIASQSDTGNITITARDPFTVNASAITDDVQIYDSTATELDKAGN